MDAALKTEIQEIVELVKTFPEPLQLRALELLLQDTLNRAEGTKPREKREREPEGGERKPPPTRGTASGLDATKLPMRVKAFMKKHSITIQQLGTLFHIEGDEYEPIWSVKATQFAKAQVQISLLQSLQRALSSGEFSFDREEVRTECEKRSSYSKNNFNANFHNNKRYFSRLDKEGLVSLSDEGMKALAGLVTELAGTGDDE